MKYPTKEQILEKEPKIREETFEIIMSWKNEFLKDWKDTPNDVKFQRLATLIIAISLIGYGRLPIVRKGDRDCYVPKEFCIYLNKNKPSILSALHETAHVLHGSSELTACRWSIYLFRTCFPGLYKKLKWKGHLLVK